MPMLLRAPAAAFACTLLSISSCTLLLSFDEEPVTSIDAEATRIPDGGGFLDAPSDAGPADAEPPMVDGCVPDSWVQLLENGNLDADTSVPWTQSMGNGGPVVRKPASFTPHLNSEKLAIFTFGDIKTQYLRQEIEVPASSDQLRLKGFRCFVSSSTTPADSVTIVAAEGDAELGVLHEYTNADASDLCNWSEFEFTLDGDFGGKTVRLGFEVAFADPATAQSTFLFDTMSLEARVCTP